MCATSLWMSCHGLAGRHGESLRVPRFPWLRGDWAMQEERFRFFWTDRDSDDIENMPQACAASRIDLRSLCYKRNCGSVK